MESRSIFPNHIISQAISQVVERRESRIDETKRNLFIFIFFLFSFNFPYVFKPKIMVRNK